MVNCAKKIDKKEQGFFLIYPCLKCINLTRMNRGIFYMFTTAMRPTKCKIYKGLSKKNYSEY